VFFDHIESMFFLSLVIHLPVCINLTAYGLSFSIIPYIRMWDLCLGRFA
jgi:hypothetical protein